MKIVHDNRPAAEEFAENFSETAAARELLAVATGREGREGTSRRSFGIGRFCRAGGGFCGGGRLTRAGDSNQVAVRPLS
jgi:hypothetical protein